MTNEIVSTDAREGVTCPSHSARGPESESQPMSYFTKYMFNIDWRARRILDLDRRALGPSSESQPMSPRRAPTSESLTRMVGSRRPPASQPLTSDSDK